MDNAAMKSVLADDDDADDISDVGLGSSPDSDVNNNAADLEPSSSSDESIIIGTRGRRDQARRDPVAGAARNCGPHDGAGDVTAAHLEDGVVTGRKRKIPYDQGNRAHARLRGRSFVSRSSKVHDARIMRPNPCSAGNRRSRCGCADITEQVRRAAFEQFYSATSNAEQRSMLSKSISIVKKQSGSSRRVVVAYTIERENGERLPVCRKFLMATLDITAEQVRTVIKNTRSGQPQTTRRGGARRSVDPQKLDALRAWIGALPAVPSHYCRAKSARRYLPSDVRSVQNLYRMYRTAVPGPLRFGVFRKVFKIEFNIGIHQPRKDKCSMCTQHERGEITEEEIHEHLAEKRALSDFFAAAQQRRDEQERVASFDLQKVLNTPHTDSMLVGYSRRYAVYNETVYESQTRRGLCFLWGETDGKRGANEVTTVVWRYLKLVDQERNVTKVSLFCDSCSGQNRNRILMSSLPVMLKNLQNIHTIQVTFLLPGHTSMPVDSVHGTIERFVRKRAVWAPSEWPAFIRAACVNPFPYEVVKMAHDDFLDWSSKELFKTNKNEDGERVPWGSIRFVQATSTCVKYATSVQEAGQEGIKLHSVIPQRSSRRGRRPSADSSLPGKAYPAPLAINPAKYRDLVALVDKGIIPQERHQEYKGMKSELTVPDELAESDEEDQ